MSKQEKIVTYPDTIETRVAILEHSINSINKTLQSLEVTLNRRFDQVDNKFDKVDARFSYIDKEMKSDFRWILSMIVGSTIGLFGLMAHGFHWF